MNVFVPSPQPNGVLWHSPQWWKWYESLDHSSCANARLVGAAPTGRTCRSMHCPECGKSVNSLGHLDDNGVCPFVRGYR